VTTFLIIAVALYIGLALQVANKARINNRNARKWFFVALAINPLIAQVLLSSRITETAENQLPTSTVSWFGQKLSANAA
jgi:hypothetical protein